MAQLGAILSGVVPAVDSTVPLSSQSSQPQPTSAPQQQTLRWKQVLAILACRLDYEDWATWFNPLERGVKAEESDRLIVAVPNARFRYVLDAEFRQVLDQASHKAAQDLGTAEFHIEFVLDEVPSLEAEPQVTGNGVNDCFAPRKFVSGPCNEFAYSVAQALVTGSRQYNPVYICGESGTGKSHLLHFIGQGLVERLNGLRILLVPAEQFVNQCISSIRFDRMSAFRERYRSLDVLLLDGIQFFVGKGRSQEELMHTLIALQSGDETRPPCLVVGTADTLPSKLDLLPWLRAYFTGALIADLQPLDRITGRQIVLQIMTAEGLDLPEPVVTYLVDNTAGGASGLKGVVTRLLAEARFRGEPLLRGQVSIEHAQQVLEVLGMGQEGIVATERVLKMVARSFDVKVSDLQGKSKAPSVVFARQVAMYLLKELTQLSYPTIAKLFGKHHSTVMYSVDVMAKKAKTDKILRERFERLKTALIAG